MKHTFYLLYILSIFSLFGSEKLSLQNHVDNAVKSSINFMKEPVFKDISFLNGFLRFVIIGGLTESFFTGISQDFFKRTKIFDFVSSKASIDFRSKALTACNIFILLRYIYAIAKKESFNSLDLIKYSSIIGILEGLLISEEEMKEDRKENLKKHIEELKMKLEQQ